jgi:hypothetical protein
MLRIRGYSTPLRGLLMWSVIVTHRLVCLNIDYSIKPSKNASEHFVFVRIFSYIFILAMLRIAFGSYLDYSSKMAFLGALPPNPCQLF